MSFLKDKLIAPYIKALAADGKRIIRNAGMQCEPLPDSYNMMDAYGYAVYFDQKLMQKGYYNDTPSSEGMHRGWLKHGIPANTGRGYLDEFFANYVPPHKGFVLICVNVIYYTSILENGAQGRPLIEMSKKYRIISMMDKDFDKLTTKYKGSFVTSV